MFWGNDSPSVIYDSDLHVNVNFTSVLLGGVRYQQIAINGYGTPAVRFPVGTVINIVFVYEAFTGTLHLINSTTVENCRILLSSDSYFSTGDSQLCCAFVSVAVIPSIPTYQLIYVRDTKLNGSAGTVRIYLTASFGVFGV